MALLEIAGVNKSFGGQPVLREIALEVDAGEIVCLLGPSGSGKTTLLRVVAGLERADSGVVRFDRRDVDGVPVHERGFGLMFQDLALFPHRNVFENIAFGLRMMRLPHSQVEARVAESLALVGLGSFVKRDVNLLSGGEQQRVALARSLAPRPRLLMFDEPLGALDRLLREQLIVEVRSILKRVGMTALYVTHDQSEAMTIADRIAILHDGRIAQVGAPEQLYRHPASAFVARFLDLGAVVSGQWLNALDQTQQGEPAQYAEAALFLIRPERARLAAPDEHGGTIAVGIVKHCTFQRGVYRVAAEVSGVSVQCDALRRTAEGEKVRLAIDAEQIS